MQLDPQAIAEFKQLYLREFGEVLSDKEVLEYAKRLISFVKVVYRKDLPKVKCVDIEGKKDND